MRVPNDLRDLNPALWTQHIQIKKHVNNCIEWKTRKEERDRDKERERTREKSFCSPFNKLPIINFKMLVPTHIHTLYGGSCVYSSTENKFNIDEHTAWESFKNVIRLANKWNIYKCSTRFTRSPPQHMHHFDLYHWMNAMHVTGICVYGFLINIDIE